MYMLRKWAVSHANSFNTLYSFLEKTLIKLHPLFNKLGYNNVEKPITFIEKNIKGLLFDCKMCGQCVLNETGMSCPMNCPKQLRNGPCGGVRSNGNCELKPEMRCVWVEACRGYEVINTSLMTKKLCTKIQHPVNFQLKGSSSWLREAQKKRDQEFYDSSSNEVF